VISAVYHMIPQNFVKKQMNIAHPTHTPNPDRFALEVNGERVRAGTGNESLVIESYKFLSLVSRKFC